MEIVYYILIFVAGTFIGSFLNLVSDRLPRGKKIITGRSQCDFCKKPLGPKNLVPIFSFVFQKGRCSFCKKKLSLYYPASEILSGLLFILAAYFSRFTFVPVAISLLAFIFYAVVFSFYLIIFLTDLKESIIPNKVVIPAIIFTALYLVFNQAYQLYNSSKIIFGGVLNEYLSKAGYWHNQIIYSLKDLGLTLLGAVIISLFFLFLVWATKGRGMGVGDVKLGFLIGLVNGFPYGFEAIFFGFVIGAICSLILVLMKRKKITDTIAFGPFLISGSVLTLLYGVGIWSWYVALGGR